MSTVKLLGQIWILIPVALLFVAGISLTLQSGHVRLSTSQGLRQMMGNLSSTAIMVSIGLVLMLLAQSVVGYKVGAAW